MSLALRGGGFVIGAVVSYVLFEVGQRVRPMQKRRIRNNLVASHPELKSFKPGPLWLPRPNKRDFLLDQFNSDPGGPLCVTGPAGSGKSSLIKEALSGRPHVVYLNLRSTPAASGEALCAAFVTQAGYLLPPNELLGRAIFSSQAVAAQQIAAVELDKGLRFITEVLREEKEEKGWTANTPGGLRVVPPVICIDEINEASQLLEDPAFWRLVDWATSISDNRLAHVVFGVSLDVAEVLDRYPGFRVRRQRVHFDFPRQGNVTQYFKYVVNGFLRDVIGAEPRLRLEPTAPAPIAVASPAAPQPVDVAVAAALPGEASTTLESMLPPSPESAGVAAAARRGWREFFFGPQQRAANVSMSGSAATGGDEVARSPSRPRDALNATADSAVSSVASHKEALTKEPHLTSAQQSVTQSAVAATPPVAAPPQPAAPVPPPVEPASPATLATAISEFPVAAAKAAARKISEESKAEASVSPDRAAAIAAEAIAAAVKQASKAQPAAAEAPAAVPVQPVAPPAPAPALPAAPAAVAAVDAGAKQLEPAAASSTTPASAGIFDSSALHAAAPAQPVAGAPTPPVKQLEPSVATAAGTATLSGVKHSAARAPAAATTPAHAPAAAAAVESPQYVSHASSVVDGLYLLDEWEVGRIVETVGGHLKDIDTVVTSIARGRHWAPALERLVADSVEAVERVFDDILHADGPLPGAAGGSGGGSQRASRVGTASAVARANRASISREYPVPAWDYQLSPTPERLGSYGRYLRAWALISELSARKYVSRRELCARVFAECPHELEFLQDAGLIMAVNVKSAARLHAAVVPPVAAAFAVPSPDGDPAVTEGSSGGNGGVIGTAPAGGPQGAPAFPFDSRHPGVFVSASSPRMRAAFRVLVADAKLQAQTARVQACVEVALLRSRERDLLARLPEAVAERAFASSQLALLLTRDSALRAAVAKELMHMQPGAPVMASQQHVATPADVTGASTDHSPSGGAAPASSTPQQQHLAAWGPVVLAAGSRSFDALPVGAHNLGLSAAIGDAHAAVLRVDAEVAFLRSSVATVRKDLEAQLGIVATAGTLSLAGARDHIRRYSGVTLEAASSTVNAAASSGASERGTASLGDNGAQRPAEGPAAADAGRLGASASKPSSATAGTSTFSSPLATSSLSPSPAPRFPAYSPFRLHDEADAEVRRAREERDRAISRFLDEASTASKVFGGAGGQGGSGGGAGGDGGGADESYTGIVYAWPSPRVQAGAPHGSNGQAGAPSASTGVPALQQQLQAHEAEWRRFSKDATSSAVDDGLDGPGRQRQVQRRPAFGSPHQQNSAAPVRRAGSDAGRKVESGAARGSSPSGKAGSRPKGPNDSGAIPGRWWL